MRESARASRLTFRGQEGPTGNGKKLRNAASAERVEILREGDQGRSGGAAGKKREAAGKPQAEPTFPESGGTIALGRRNRERPPGELARRETGRDLKGSPGEERMVGKPGSPGGKEPQRTIAGLPEGCPRESRRLAGWTPDGWSPACRRDVRRMVTGSPGRRPTGGSGACLVEVWRDGSKLASIVPDRALSELAPAEPDWEPTGVETPRPEPETGPVATPAPFTFGPCLWPARAIWAATRRPLRRGPHVRRLLLQSIPAGLNRPPRPRMRLRRAGSPHLFNGTCEHGT